MSVVFECIMELMQQGMEQKEAIIILNTIRLTMVIGLVQVAMMIIKQFSNIELGLQAWIYWMV